MAGEDQNGIGEVTGASKIRPMYVKARKKLKYKLEIQNNAATTAYPGLGLTITMPEGVTFVKAKVKPRIKGAEVGDSVEDEVDVILKRRNRGRDRLRRKQRKQLKKGLVTSKKA